MYIWRCSVSKVYFLVLSMLLFDISFMKDKCRDETGYVSLFEALLMHVIGVATPVVNCGIARMPMCLPNKMAHTHGAL